MMCVCTHVHMHAHVTLQRPNGKLGCPEALSALVSETRSLIGLGLADLTMLAGPRTPGIFVVSASPEWDNRAIMLGVLAGFLIIIQQALHYQTISPGLSWSFLRASTQEDLAFKEMMGSLPNPLFSEGQLETGLSQPLRPAPTTSLTALAPSDGNWWF